MTGLADFVRSARRRDWRVVPMWTLFRRVKRTGFAEEELLSVYREHGVIPTSSRDDNHNKPSLDLSGYQLVEPGDLATNKMKTWQGSIAISRYRGIVSPAYFIYRPTQQQHDQYLHYLLRSQPYVAEYGRISKGVRVNQWDLDEAAFRALPVPFPDLPTQKAIAAFLDRETARIDQLIEKKQRLVELLAARFDLQVRHGVTCGYRSAKNDLVNSEVAYLGEVPAHWTVEKIGWRYSVQLGKMLDASKQTGELRAPYLRVADVQWDEINTEDLPTMDFSLADRTRYQLKKGDLIVNEGGSYVGRSAIWEGEKANCFYQKALHRLRPRDKCRDTTAFLLWVMWFATKSGVFVANGNQTTIDHLTAEALRRYRFAFPPQDEQEEIANRLRIERKRNAELTTAASRSIDRMKEYRSALITAAVTGQIDVETWSRRGEGDRRLDRIEEEMAG